MIPAMWWARRRTEQETTVTEPQGQQARAAEQKTGDEAKVAETIAAARTEEQPWKLASENIAGGQVWVKPVGEGDGHLAAWTPDERAASEQLDQEEEKIQRFQDAPDEVRERIDRLESDPPRMAMEGPLVETEGRPAARTYTTGDPITMQFAAGGYLPHLSAGRSAVPKPLVSQHRETCQHCGGSGFVPGISDYLRESAALLGDNADEVVRAFYRRLFTAAPEVAKLFPGNPTEGDLGTDHRGAKQREKLLAAIVALADLYDPDDGEKMDRLDRALTSFGRSHAAFARADGTVQGATWEEYGAVKDALFATLVSATGNAWKPEYTASWSQAYDYAAAMMIAEQHRSGFSLPRFPRA